MTDQQDLRSTQSGPPPEQDHDPVPDGRGESGLEPTGPSPEPPRRGPRWRWVALAVAVVAVIGLVGLTLAYQGTQDDLDAAEERVSALVAANETQEAQLQEQEAQLQEVVDDAETLRSEVDAITERAEGAEATIAATDAAVAGLFTADTGGGIPGVTPEQLQCLSEALVADIGSAAVINGLTAAAFDPNAPEVLEMGFAVITSASGCGISPEVFTGLAGG